MLIIRYLTPAASEKKITFHGQFSMHDIAVGYLGIFCWYVRPSHLQSQMTLGSPFQAMFFKVFTRYYENWLTCKIFLKCNNFVSKPLFYFNFTIMLLFVVIMASEIGLYDMQQYKRTKQKPWWKFVKSTSVIYLCKFLSN